MPPPASTTLKTLGQWSRPASLLILGVRPNSLETMTTVRFEQAGAVEVADQGGERLVERRHLAVHAGDDLGVHVPAAVVDRDEPHAGGDQPAGHQQPLAGGVAAVFVADLGRLGGDVERLAGLLRADQAVGPLVEGVHRRDVVALLALGEVGVDRVEDRPPGGEPRLVDPARQVQVLHLEARVGRVAAQAERRERRAQVARARVDVGLVGNADVRRQVVLRAVFVRDHAPHARDTASAGLGR